LQLEQEVWAKAEEPGRFIYYPDHMVSLPTDADFDVRNHGVLGVLGNVGAVLKTILSEPLFDKFIPSTFSTTKHSHMDYIWDDKETVGEYVTRMCGGRRELVDNVLSAMMHGIYGGDVWKLGVASNSMLALPFKTRALVDGRKKELQERTRALSDKEDDYWESRQEVEQFISEAMLKKPIQAFDAKLLDEITNTPVARVMAGWGPRKALGLKDGFGTLVDRLARELEGNGNVKVVFEPVKKMELAGERMMVCFDSSSIYNSDLLTRYQVSSGQTNSYDKVISTLYSRTLSTLVPSNTLPSLAATSAVTIRLVNLWSPHPNLNYPHNGFGYLLPQTVPLEQNPHAALGVIFDSDAKPSGADDTTPSYGDTIPGTKLTVMLGGHHWSDLPADFLPDAHTSDTAAIQAAKETVQIQLGIPQEAWTVCSTKLCVDCIPQQLPGHIDLMASAHQELLLNFKGKLAVCGGSYTAPGVPGSLRAARDVAAQTTGRERGQKFGVGETGLERFTYGTGREMFVFKDGDWLAGFRGKGREGSAGGEGVDVDGDR
jgi:oxygen-dependent protoporphyrinogen oxidase